MDRISFNEVVTDLYRDGWSWLCYSGGSIPQVLGDCKALEGIRVADALARYLDQNKVNEEMALFALMGRGNERRIVLEKERPFKQDKYSIRIEEFVFSVDPNSPRLLVMA